MCFRPPSAVKGARICSECRTICEDIEDEVCPNCGAELTTLGTVTGSAVPPGQPVSGMTPPKPPGNIVPPKAPPVPPSPPKFLKSSDISQKE